MPIYDRKCTACDHLMRDRYEPMTSPAVDCEACGALTERVWLPGASAAVHGDDPFVGGKTFENMGHRPVTVHSRAEYQRELRARGLQEFVRHAPEQGSDKSKHTGRWI